MDINFTVRRGFLAVLGLFLLLSGPSFAEETKFFSMLDDLPLMEGLYELPQDGLSFDKPEGRIVEVSAASESKNINEIRGFYASTLVELGWTAAGADTYVRDGERLVLRFESGNPQNKALNIVYFSLSPQE